MPLNNPQDEAAIRAAYNDFLAAKYPGEAPRDTVFRWFDPDDDIPDRGLVFLPPDRSLMLKHRDKVTFITTARIALTARRKPTMIGWHIAIGPGWMWLGETVRDVLELFDEMRQEMERSA